MTQSKSLLLAALSAVLLACGSVADGDSLDAGPDAGHFDASPFDASPFDASPFDAAIDSGVDAGTDAAPGPPVSSGQSASLVLGQANFTSMTVNAGGLSAKSLYAPRGVAALDDYLWACDSGNTRVLGWKPRPTSDQTAASVVVGQAGFTTAQGAVNQSTINVGIGFSCRVFSDGTRLFVSDPRAHRVLIWNTLPTQNGQPADVVLGQLSFTTQTTGSGATALNGPLGLWSDGQRLVVADTLNHRVLIWKTMPTTNGKAADLVLGQTGFGQAEILPVSASSMSQPWGVYSDGTRLFVADRSFDRVMVWRTFPTSNNQPADFFVGQDSATTATENAGQGATNPVGLFQPTSVVVARGSLFISDVSNSRVVIHTPVPDQSGEEADFVLGQDNLTSNVAVMGSPTANRIFCPDSLAAAGDRLYVADCAWHRVVGFDLLP